MVTNNSAIVCVAVGQTYLKEAARLAESAKRTNPELPFVLCTTEGECDYQLPETVYKHWGSEQSSTEYKQWFLKRVNYYNHIINDLDYDKILFMDSDTYLCDNIKDIFHALDRFDIVATQAISRQTLPNKDIPNSFPELHCGVLGISNVHLIRQIFYEWLKVYESNPRHYGNDQPPLREVLWNNSQVQIGVLPPEYCFRYRWGGLIGSKVKILHGKEHRTPYEKVEKEVNADVSAIRIYNRRELA